MVLDLMALDAVEGSTLPLGVFFVADLEAADRHQKGGDGRNFVGARQFRVPARPSLGKPEAGERGRNRQNPGIEFFPFTPFAG